MKLKNKIIALALGIAILTGCVFLTKQTNVGALAYSNNGGSLTDGGTTLSNVKMTITTQSGMIPIQNYNDFIISKSTSSLFNANKSYNVDILMKDVTINSIPNLKMQLINSSGGVISNVSYNKKEEVTNNGNMTQTYRVRITATVSASQSFRIKLTDSSMSMDGSLNERLLESVKVVETDTVAPVINLYQSEITYNVGINNITPTQIVAIQTAIDDVDGNVATYLVSSNVDFNKVGRYTIVVGAKDKAGNESTAYIYINIVDRQAPVISGWQGVYYTNFDSPTTLANVLSKISAYDEYKGTVPVNIVSDGYSGKENVLGDHIVKLSATDGTNTSEITINIIVVDATKPTISGPTSLTSNMSNPLTEADIRSKLSASDNADKSLTINLVQDNFTANKLKKGSYTISYNTTDDSGNVSDTFVVTIMNKDDIKPIITGSTSVNGGSSTKLTIDQIKTNANLKSSDNIDSNLTISVTEDNYSSNFDKVGSHTIKFKVTDVSDTFMVTIVVKDTTKPVINGSDSIRSNLSSPLTEEYIRSQLTATDNVDDNLEIELIEDLFTNNKYDVGNYQIKYKVTDNAGNVSSIFVMSVEVYDDEPPIITGKNEYRVSVLGKLNVQNLLKVLVATDNDGEQPTLNIVSDNYSNSNNVLGNYEVVITATDINGNVSNEFKIAIHVVDDIPPIFFVSEDIIFVDDTLTLTTQQIIDGVLAQTGINMTNVTECSLETDYFSSPNVPNVYTLSLRVLMDDGSVEDIEGKIEVISTENEDDINNNTEENTEQSSNALKEFEKGVLKVLKNIWEFFVKLFKTLILGWIWDEGGTFDPKWNNWN